MILISDVFMIITVKSDALLEWILMVEVVWCISDLWPDCTCAEMSGDSRHIASAETSELLSSSTASEDEGPESPPSSSCVSISDAVVRYKARHVTGSTLHLHHAFADIFPRHSPPKTAFPPHSSMLSRPGPRYILFTEGDVQMFRCNSRSTVTKLLKTQCMRQWESTRLILGSFNMIIYWVSGHRMWLLVFLILKLFFFILHNLDVT